MSTQKKDQYRETVPHKSHFVPVSVHTTKIEIPTETDGVAALPEKNFPALYLHWHPELEFFYVEEGEVEFFIENHAQSHQGWHHEVLPRCRRRLRPAAGSQGYHPL